MVQAAYPAADIGMIIRSATAPDVLTYPELAVFHWEETSTGAVYRYNGSSWEYIKASVTIPDGTISLGKLDVGSATAYQILAVNAGATAVTFQDISGVMGASSFPAISGYGSQKFLTISGGFAKLSGVDPSAFVAKSIEMSKILSAGTVGQYPAADGSGGWTWTTPATFSVPDGTVKILSSSRLSATGGTIGQSIRVASGGYFEFYTPSAAPTYLAQPTAVLEYQEAAGTDGAFCYDQATGAVIVAPLNTEVHNDGIVTNLAGDGTFELAAGTYLIQADASVGWSLLVGGACNSLKHEFRLYNETAGSIVSSKALKLDSSSYAYQLTAVLRTVVTVASATFFSLRFSAVPTGGSYPTVLWGVANDNGTVERYVQVSIQRIA